MLLTCHLFLHRLRRSSFWILTIESHVLGEGLGQHNVVALFNEVTHSPGVTIYVSTGKALIGHVEEHEQVPFLQHEKEGQGETQERRTKAVKIQHLSLVILS